jgi:hypothetical protein
VEDRSGKMRTRLVFDVWREWPLHRRYSRPSYAPGKEHDLEDGSFNSWSPYPYESVEGDISLWHRFLNHLLGGNPPEERRWFERWLAYQLQHPGIKMFTAPVFWSETQGSGKSLTFETYGSIYGRNFGLITQKQLAGAFNPGVVRKQFILADEINNRKNVRLDMDQLKLLITRPEIEVNTKNIRQYVIPDVVNWAFTTNHRDGFFLDNYDRRFAIFHVTEKKLIPELADALREWKASGEAAKALRFYFEHLDLGDFNPFAAAPVTQGRGEMIEANLSELDQFVSDLMVSAPYKSGEARALDLSFPFREGDLFTCEKIRDCYDSGRKGQATSTKAVGAALRKAGAVATAPIFVEGRTRRPLAIRLTEKWAKAPIEDLKAEFLRANPENRQKYIKAEG